MRKKPIMLSLILSLLFSSYSVFSDNLRFLRHQEGPIAHFSDEDFELFKQALKTTLNEQQDKEISSWENIKTGASGTLKPLRTFNEEDTVCRRLLMANKAGGQSGKFVFNFCKQSDDTWKIVVK